MQDFDLQLESEFELKEAILRELYALAEYADTVADSEKETCNI